jgi:hypothetical protein
MLTSENLSVLVGGWTGISAVRLEAVCPVQLRMKVDRLRQLGFGEAFSSRLQFRNVKEELYFWYCWYDTTSGVYEVEYLVTGLWVAAV